MRLRRSAGRSARRCRCPRRPRPPPHEFVQAVEFPYYLYPRTLWERELVWLKNIGVDTVEFSIPWNWHQLAPGDYDFTGRTSPRRDLVGFVRTLAPARTASLGAAAAARRRVARQRRAAGRRCARAARLAAGTANACWPPKRPATAAPSRTWKAACWPSTPLRRRRRDCHFRPSIPTPSPAAAKPLASAAQGALLWTNVEDALYPAGWARRSLHPAAARARWG